MEDDTARQYKASHDFALAYEWIFCSIVGVLTLRNIVTCIHQWHHLRRIAQSSTTTLDEKGPSSHSHAMRPSLVTRVEATLLHPLFWIITPVELLIILATFSINVGFMLAISSNVRGVKSAYMNTPHEIALRCGHMALAQAPPVFALTGRNSLVQFLTGIDYQQLRFAHKTLGLTWFLLALYHVLGMIISNFAWSGHEGVEGLISMPIAKWGLLTIASLFILVTLSQPWIRRRQYEIFIVSHLVGASLALVGVYYHAEPLRPYTYSAIGIWALERLLRGVALFFTRFHPRAPLVTATATLSHGAIVLRVPSKGNWRPGQHAYLSFPSVPRLLGQSHPFSIANVPSSRNKTADEMLFVMRVRKGATMVLSERLRKAEGQSSTLKVALEGPYGRSIETKLFHDVLFIAGGSGITHVQSMLADLIQNATSANARTTRVHLVWVIQHAEQSSWIISSLLATSSAAHSSNIELDLSFYVTRGISTPTESPSSSPASTSTDSVDRAPPVHHGRRTNSVTTTNSTLDQLLLHDIHAQNTTVLTGRPAVNEIVPGFCDEASGRTLIVACGPDGLMDEVRSAVKSVRAEYEVMLDVASFEC